MRQNLFDPPLSGGATFSADNLHRMLLWRTWEPTLPLLVWCLLNPSVAGADTDDLTLAKCIGFARRNGYGRVLLVNLFTLVSTNPDNLASRVPTANTTDADHHLRWAARQPHSRVAVGWGSKPWAQDRARHVLQLLRTNTELTLCCLGTCKDGSPKHPSRLGYDTPLREL